MNLDAMTRRQLFLTAPALELIFLAAPAAGETPDLSAMWMLDPLGNINIFIHGPQDAVAVAEIVYEDDSILKSATGACFLLPLRAGESHNGMIAIPVASQAIRMRWITVRAYPNEPLAEIAAVDVRPAEEVR